MKKIFLRLPLLAAVFCATILIAASAKAGEMTKVFYPNEKELEFSVEVPSDWKLIPQGEEGAEEYFEVEGPNGLELSFRTVPGADVDKAVDKHFAYLTEHFTDVEQGEVTTTKINGMTTILGPAKAKDEDGELRDIGAGWFVISEGVLGELWYNVKVSDESGTKAAIAVLNSLKGAEGKASKKKK